VRGAAVTFAGQLAKIIIQLLSVMILARLLTPESYGLIAMVTAVTGLAAVFMDFGLSTAAIQAPLLTRRQQFNLFWINTGLGALLTIIAVALAPALAAFYQQPELIPVTLALAWVFLFNGMATQYRADLSRRMMFRRLAFAEVAASLVALGVAVVLATRGAGVWALVAQILTQVVVMLAVVVISAGWLPRLYDRGASVGSFLSFGWRLAGSQVVNYIGNNIDTVMLGLRVGPTSLGLYNRSYQLIMTPLGQIRGPLNTVAIPVLSRLQDRDQQFGDFVVKGQIALGYTLVAGLAFVAGSSETLVAILLGPQWEAASGVLALLAVAGGVTTLSSVGYWVYVTKGLVNHLLTYSFISTGIRVTCVIVGSSFGLLGVAAGMAAAAMIAWPLSFWWLSRRAAIPVRRLWMGGVRVLLFSGLILAACRGVATSTTHLAVWSQLALELLAAAGTYAALTLLVPPFRKDVSSVLTNVRTALRRAPAAV
jgi:PST family polysaccharide transporter